MSENTFLPHKKSRNEESFPNCSFLGITAAFMKYNKRPLPPESVIPFLPATYG
jgi:hypothetical protein